MEAATAQNIPPGQVLGDEISPEFLSHILGTIYDAALDEAGWVKAEILRF